MFLRQRHQAEMVEDGSSMIKSVENRVPLRHLATVGLLSLSLTACSWADGEMTSPLSGWFGGPDEEEFEDPPQQAPQQNQQLSRPSASATPPAPAVQSSASVAQATQGQPSLVPRFWKSRKRPTPLPAF